MPCNATHLVVMLSASRRIRILSCRRIKMTRQTTRRALCRPASTRQSVAELINERQKEVANQGLDSGLQRTPMATCGTVRRRVTQPVMFNRASSCCRARAYKELSNWAIWVRLGRYVQCIRENGHCALVRSKLEVFYIRDVLRVTGSLAAGQMRGAL